MKNVILAYIPVPHLGYLELIKRHQPADVALLPLEVMQHINPVIADQLGRDMLLRGIPPMLVQKTLHGEFGDAKVFILDTLESLKAYDTIIMPEEDISLCIKENVTWAEVIFDSWFQRWDWRNTNTSKEVIADYAISEAELDTYFMAIAKNEAVRSSDFWRQVGALVSIESGVLVAHNEHMPTSMEPYINGDMRIIMMPGEKPEICGAIHAEKALFAQALRMGLVLQGKDMYVTTFPCLPCAQMIARVGIKKLFFKEGYSNQNALEDLRSKGVEIIRVQ